MSGDGLTDLYAFRNARDLLLPNLGYGRFGAKVAMDARLGSTKAGAIRPARVQSPMSDGFGHTDLIYLHPGGTLLYRNQAATAGESCVDSRRFSQDRRVRAGPAVDLLGTGPRAWCGRHRCRVTRAAAALPST